MKWREQGKAEGRVREGQQHVLPTCKEYYRNHCNVADGCMFQISEFDWLVGPTRNGFARYLFNGWKRLSCFQSYPYPFDSRERTMSTIHPTMSSKRSWLVAFGDSTTRIKTFDVIERCAILVLFAYFLTRTLSAFLLTWNAGNLLMLLTESMLVGFILCRKSANSLSLRWGDWILAFGATSLPLLAEPKVSAPHFWNDLAVTLMFLGLIVQVVSKLALGRRFGVVAANRGLCLFGPYRIVRHPIYMGYLFTHIGLCLLNPAIWNIALFACVYALQIPRILAEEKMLGEDEAYQQYKQVVPYRLVPGVF